MSIRRGVVKRGDDSRVRAAYRDALVRTAFRLVEAAFRSLRSDALQRSEETDITGLLVEAMRNVIEGDAREEWAARLSVHEDLPLKSEGRIGKQRPRIDIEVESTSLVPHPRFQFEAKRLYRGDSVAEYVGPEGLGCFTDGKYGVDHENAGMLGYVQDRTASEWADLIQKKLASDRSLYCLADSGPIWATHPFISWALAFVSAHARPTGAIDIHHAFLMCC